MRPVFASGTAPVRPHGPAVHSAGGGSPLPRTDTPPDSAAPSAAPAAASGKGPHDAEERIRYRVPLGETGHATLRTARPADSFLRLFRIESIHAAAHRQMALALGEAVRAQDIRIRTGMTPEGELIAVAGATETEVDAPEPRSAPSPVPESAPAPPTTSPPAWTPELQAGASDPALFDAGETPNPSGSAGALPEGAAAAGDGTLLLRELAYVSDLHRMLVASGDAIFGMSRRPMPRLALSGSMGSALQAMTNRRVLRKATHRPNLFTQLRDLSERQTSQLLKAIEPLERSLRDLLATLRGLEQDGRALTALRADGGAPALSARVTGPDAAPGTHTVRVERLARAHAVESGVTATDGTPLSALVTEEGEPLLAGSGFTFSLNGVEVAVSLDDSLPEIARIINRGEDRNLNGVLDTGDAWTPTEDADGDGELDGGTAAHGIVAEVVADRLRLRMASPGGASIEIADPDGLLEALGMVEQTALGRFRFPNELTAPSGARFTVGDTQYDRPGNEVTDAIPGVELTLLQEGTETVEVAVAGDGEAVVQELRPLLERYNGAVRAFNRTLSSTLPGLLRHEAHVSRTYLDLRHAMEDPVSGQPVTLRTTAQAGIVNTGAARVTFHEVQLARARAQIRGSGARGPLERIKSPPSVVNALDEIGITAESDNTLALEPDRIRTAVEEQVEALGDLFRREGGGVLPRLVREVEQAADPVGGLMAFLRRRLQALGASTFPQDAVRRLQQAQASVLRARLVQSSLGSLIA